MKIRPNSLPLAAAIACLSGACFSGAALAQAPAAQRPSDPAIDDAQARYQRQRALCESGLSAQDRATCLREAGAALAEARRGGLSNQQNEATYRSNALARCQRLPPDDRHACEARMSGQGTTRGSVESGGIYREFVTREVLPRESRPAAPAAPAVPATPATREPAPSIPPAGAVPPPRGATVPGTAPARPPLPGVAPPPGSVPGDRTAPRPTTPRPLTPQQPMPADSVPRETPPPELAPREPSSVDPTPRDPRRPQPLPLPGGSVR